MPSPAPEFLALQAALAGEYSLARELGRGGMGVVFLAREVQLDRDVAIKVLPAALAADAAARDRFLIEARTAARLSHPHIVPIHRVGEADGLPYFVMTYVDGGTLGERLRARGPMAPDEVTRVLREVAWALAYAHGRGVIHRDIKPDNILLEAGTARALVTDFGIAQGGGAAAAVGGTPHFMSPEQGRGDAVDARSDLYALGVVGHLAATGQLPHGTVALGIPPRLYAAISRCLAADPGDRFPDAETLAAALAPAGMVRAEMPTSLRAWLEARNPMLAPYVAWIGGFGTLTFANLVAWVTGNRPDGPADIVLLAGIAAMPLVPMLGFHLHEARRQFRAGFSLDDLQDALRAADREREATEALDAHVPEPGIHRALRAATVGALTWVGTLVSLLLADVVREQDLSGGFMVGSFLSALVTMAASNALGVRFIPSAVRRAWQRGLRTPLWRGRFARWLSARLGAPEGSRALGAGVFRPTEVNLGRAMLALFERLPAPSRETLRDLPSVVASLEAQASAARAELEVVSALSASGGPAHALAARREGAQRQLGRSIAALEELRLGLLRLHGGEADLAPMTTLLEGAGAVADDVRRLAEAEREVEVLLGGIGPADQDPRPT